MDPLDPVREAKESDRRIGGYRIVREIGRGSMGIVYEAIDEARGLSVALKILVGSASLEEKAVRRFQREAEMLQRISHPNIVPIYRFGEERGTYYYAMHLVQGETVSSLIRRGAIEPRRAAEMVRQAALGLDCAHRMTIIHRDIKPANLIIDSDQRVLLTDFGLATHERAATITDSGALVGTPMYMSPEQVSGAREDIDPRSDVYSLGATLYEMLTGRPPFESDNVQTILRQIVDVDPRLPRRLNPNVPLDLETITLKAMEKQPSQRYASAREFAEDLDRFLRNERIVARRSRAAVRLARQVRRHPRLTASIAAAGLVLVISITGSIVGVARHARDRAYQELLDGAANANRDKDWRLACKKLDEAVARRPGDQRPRIQRAIARAAGDDAAGARQDLLVAAELDPHSADAWIQLGSLERDLGNRDAGVRAFEEARARAPRSPVPCLKLAEMAIADKDDRRARAHLETAKEIAPGDPRVIEALAGFAAHQGLREEADRYIKMLQLVNPLRATPPGLGEKVAETAQKQIEDIRGFPDTIRKTPEAASNFLAQIQTSLARADARDRIRKLTEELGETPDVARTRDLRLQRAQAYREIGEFDAAATDYVLATQVAPADPEPWKRLARMHVDTATWENRNFKDAVRFAEKAAALDPGAPSCQETLADAYLAADRLEDAARILDAIMARTAQGPDRERYAEKRSRCTPHSPR